MKTNTIYILYTLVDCGESVSDCHTLYSTLEKAKAAMEVEIQECMKTSAMERSSMTLKGFMSL